MELTKQGRDVAKAWEILPRHGSSRKAYLLKGDLSALNTVGLKEVGWNVGGIGNGAGQQVVHQGAHLQISGGACISL